MNSYLTAFNESERADYLVTLAHMVGVDGEVSSEEILALRSLCEKFVIGPEERGRVMAATVGALELPEVLTRLGKTQLKYGLLLDLCLSAYWDGQVTSEERSELDELSKGLGVAANQVESVLALAHKIAQKTAFENELKAAMEQGVPREALAMAAGLEGDQPLG